jgi:hypothetical protein
MPVGAPLGSPLDTPGRPLAREAESRTSLLLFDAATADVLLKRLQRFPSHAREVVVAHAEPLLRGNPLDRPIGA